MGGPEPETPAQSALRELLELSLGNGTIARAAVAHALTLSGREGLPHEGPELLAFVRAHLVGIVTAELGPRLTLALLDDLAERLDPDAQEPESHVRSRSSAPPAASARRPIARLDLRTSATPPPGPALGVVVVDPDKVTRPALARALLRAHWSVTVIDAPAELAVASDEGEDFAIALVNMQHPLASAIVRELMTRYPHATVVARCRDGSAAHAELGALGVQRLEVRSSDAPPEELVDVIRRTLGI